MPTTPVPADTGTTQLVPVFTSAIGGVPANVCDGRALHTFLAVGKRFASWIAERIEKYGFVEEVDYRAISQKREIGRGKGKTDYHLSLDMAKELSMVENNTKGREARRYFIDCEREALAARSGPAPQDEPRPISNGSNILFSNNDLRLAMVDNHAWFLARDVAEALGYTQTWSVLRYVRKGEYGPVDDFDPLRTLANNNPLTGITTTGLWGFLVHSRKPKAKAMLAWLEDVALPTLACWNPDTEELDYRVALNDESHAELAIATDTSPRHQVLLTMEGAEVVKSETLADDVWIGRPGDIHQLAKRRGLCVVSRETLHAITTGGASMRVCHAQLMDGVHALEEETGEAWYGRGH